VRGVVVESSVKLTVPLPVLLTLVMLVMLIKLSLLIALQAHVAAVVTLTLPLPPLKGKNWPVEESVKPFTVRLTAFDVAGGEHVPLTTTS